MKMEELKNYGSVACACTLYDAVMNGLSGKPGYEFLPYFSETMHIVPYQVPTVARLGNTPIMIPMPTDAIIRLASVRDKLRKADAACSVKPCADMFASPEYQAYVDALNARSDTEMEIVKELNSNPDRYQWVEDAVARMDEEYLQEHGWYEDIWMPCPRPMN